MDPVPDPLLFRKSGSVGNRTRDLCICSQKLWPLDHRGSVYDYQSENPNEVNLMEDIGIDEWQYWNGFWNIRLTLNGVNMWDLWWSKWNYERFFYEYAGFQDSLSFHQCSALVFNFKSVRNEKNWGSVATFQQRNTHNLLASTNAHITPFLAATCFDWSPSSGGSQPNVLKLTTIN